MTAQHPAGRPAPSLGRRLLLGGTVLVCVALAVTGLAIGVALHRFIRAQIDGRLDGQIAAVADALRPAPAGGWRLERSVDGPPFDRPGSGWSWIVLAPGPVLRSRSLGNDDVRFDPDDLGPEDVRPGHFRPSSDNGGPMPPGPPPSTTNGIGPGEEALHLRVRHLQVGPEPVTVVAAAPRQAIAGPLREAMLPMGLVLAGLAALLVAGGVAQIRLGLRPLRVLETALGALRDGRDTRIAGPQPAELRPLVAELNALLDQHDSNLERARRHVANLAHGLKTPLATLDLRLAEGAGDGQAASRQLVAAMDRMIRHHLVRARTAALGGPSRARVDLPARLADLRDAFARLYAEKGVTVQIEAADGLAAACEAQDLDEILGNLLDNACRWARERVQVVATAAGPDVRIEIGDDGPGLSDQATAEALRPGQRLDEQAAGYGFGLPIARELAELYGGSVRLDRAALGGLAVIVALPRAGDTR